VGTEKIDLWPRGKAGTGILMRPSKKSSEIVFSKKQGYTYFSRQQGHFVKRLYFIGRQTKYLYLQHNQNL
jgi:hypothetical protein